MKRPSWHRCLRWFPLRSIVDDRGIAAVEFALIAPILMLVVLATFQFGITINNYLEMTGAVGSGAQQLSLSRTSATPWTTSNSAVTASLPNLTAQNITVTLKVNGTACSNDTGCSTSLAAAVGGTASVQATYPCNLTILGNNFAPSCLLTSVASGMIQ